MKKIVLGIAATVLLLSGCSSMGGGEDKFSASYVKSHVIEKKTTQAEVQALYGVPDSQTTHSNGSKSWTYNKSGNLSTASSVMGYIPGASTITSALGMANTASETATEASGKLTGNTEHHDNSLTIYFDRNNIVDDWIL